MRNELSCEEILDFQIVCDPVSEIVKNSLVSNSITIINTLNAHSYIVQKTNNEFKEALKRSNFLIPDGSGIVLATKILKKKSIKKVSGFDLFIETLSQINISKGRIFLLGSSEEVLLKMKKRMSREYPNISCGYLSPPFKSSFSKQDIGIFVRAIKDFSPDVIFVGLTAPKQEILIDKIYSNFDKGLISGVGAVFDFYARTIKRPNKLLIMLHLEWLGRFMQNPKKMFSRVFITMPLFIVEIIITKISEK